MSAWPAPGSKRAKRIRLPEGEKLGFWSKFGPPVTARSPPPLRFMTKMWRAGKVPPPPGNGVSTVRTKTICRPLGDACGSESPLTLVRRLRPGLPSVFSQSPLPDVAEPPAKAIGPLAPRQAASAEVMPTAQAARKAAVIAVAAKRGGVKVVIGHP